jgi:hypothetical protein
VRVKLTPVGSDEASEGILVAVSRCGQHPLFVHRLVPMLP